MRERLNTGQQLPVRSGGAAVRRPAMAAAALAAMLLLAGCGDDIEHGTITGKQYQAARQHTDMTPIYGTRCSVSGKSISCQTVIAAWMPQSVTDPECYRLDLRAGKKTGQVCVSPADYERVRTGDQW